VELTDVVGKLGMNEARGLSHEHIFREPAM